MIVRLASAACAALSLAACHLVDQRSFDPDANRLPPRPAPVAGPGQAGPPPLVTIRFDTPELDYRSAVRASVGQALAAKRDVLFEVVTEVPAKGTPDERIQAAEASTSLGRDVAETIIGAGADAGQVELASRAEASATVPEVRVYVH